MERCAPPRRAACCLGRRSTPAGKALSVQRAPTPPGEPHALFASDEGADALIGEDLEEQRVRHAAVDDVHALHAAARGVERRADLRQHAARDHAFRHQVVDLFRRQPRQQLAGLVEHARRVGEHHQLLGAQHLGELAGDQVGVDVVGHAVRPGADRRHHRDETAGLERLDHRGVDRVDFTHLAEVDVAVLLRRQQHLARADEGAVLPGQADRLAARLVDELHHFLVDLAAEHHLDHVHGLAVGDAHALHELALLAQAREQLLDLGPAAVHHHRVHADQLEQHHVAREAGLRLVHLLRQREAARDLAERALGVEQALVLRDFLLPLDISGQRYLRAIDGDLDVFLADARDLGGDNVRAVLLGHVDLHAGQLGAPLHRKGTHQKALEQVIDQLVERIESGNVSHLLSPFLKLHTLHVGAAQRVSRPLESLAMSDFRTRVEGERPYLLRYAALQLRDRPTAEDVVQETLLAALAGEASFGGRSNLRTWLTGILKHKIVDAIRRASREAPTADEDQMEELFDETGHWREMPSAWADPDASLEQKEFFVKLEECLSRLPARTAQAFMLREHLGFETDEICKELGVTATHCWVLLYRARMALRLCLEQNWFGR